MSPGMTMGGPGGMMKHDMGMGPSGGMMMGRYPVRRSKDHDDLVSLR